MSDPTREPLPFESYGPDDPDPSHRPATREEDRYMREAMGFRVSLGPQPMAAIKAALAARVQRAIDATDAERECVHGKLPGDRVQTCDCWGSE